MLKLSDKVTAEDYRTPPDSTWRWAKNYEEAVVELCKGDIEFASLDHDLADEHYESSVNHGRPSKEKTGYNLICWMEENGVWPSQGVRIHTMNTSGKKKMLTVVNKVYGKTFQYQIPDTHKV